MILHRPLNREEVIKRIGDNADGTISVRLEIDFDDLINHDIEGFNDLVEERILEHGLLTDIRYKVAGHAFPTDEGSGSVIIEVTAEVVGDDAGLDDELTKLLEEATKEVVTAEVVDNGLEEKPIVITDDVKAMIAIYKHYSEEIYNLEDEQERYRIDIEHATGSDIASVLATKEGQGIEANPFAE